MSNDFSKFGIAFDSQTINALSEISRKLNTPSMRKAFETFNTPAYKNLSEKMKDLSVQTKPAYGHQLNQYSSTKKKKENTPKKTVRGRVRDDWPLIMMTEGARISKTSSLDSVHARVLWREIARERTSHRGEKVVVIKSERGKVESLKYDGISLDYKKFSDRWRRYKNAY